MDEFELEQLKETPIALENLVNSEAFKKHKIAFPTPEDFAQSRG